jgi:DnaK suppressor protein
VSDDIRPDGTLFMAPKRPPARNTPPPPAGSPGLTAAHLAEIEQELLSERVRVRRTLERLGESIQDTLGSTLRAGGDLVDMTNEAVLREHASMLGTRSDERLREITAALDRLRAAPDTFGLCERCGEAIGILRLSVLPATLRCAKHSD